MVGAQGHFHVVLGAAAYNADEHAPAHTVTNRFGCRLKPMDDFHQAQERFVRTELAMARVMIQLAQTRASAGFIEDAKRALEQASAACAEVARRLGELDVSERDG